MVNGNAYLTIEHVLGYKLMCWR